MMKWRKPAQRSGSIRLSRIEADNVISSVSFFPLFSGEEQTLLTNRYPCVTQLASVAGLAGTIFFCFRVNLCRQDTG